MHSIISRYLGVVLISLLMLGCDSGGTDTPANPITNTNKEEVSRAISTAMQEVIASDSAPLSLQPARNITPDARVDYSSFCTGGGSASYTYTTSSFVYTFTDCVYSYGGYTVTYNGTITYTATSTLFSLSYNNFSVSSNYGYSESISGSYSCTISGTTYDCSYSSSVSYGSVTYSVGSATLTGDLATGYSFSYTMSSSTYGTITVSTTSAVTFNCGNNIPDSGTISFSGANGSSGTITFNDCSSFTVTVDGVSDIYYW